MNAGQRQQYIASILGHRRYDGSDTDGGKSLSLDEFISHIRQCKSSTGMSDTVMLALISAFMQGKAFSWWQTNSFGIHTIDELEVRMRTRFEGKSMDSMSQIMAFSTRQQKESENVLDYMDDMRKKAFNIRPALSEEQVIRTVVDNANSTYKWLLASRQFESLDMLNRHLEYLAKMKVTQTEHKPYNKKDYKPYKARTVHATEVELDDKSEGGGEPSVESLNMSMLVDAIEKATKTLASRQERMSSKPTTTNKPIMEMSVKEACVTGCHTENGIACAVHATEFKCYGCGTPGVIRRNCEKCRDIQSKNDGAAQ